jgi:hypothetical protein
MEEQKLLFEMIKSKIPGHYKLTEKMEEELNLSPNATYRRIRGEVELTFSEILTLSRNYNLSLDDICNLKSNQGALFRYAPVNFSDPESYYNYVKKLIATVTAMKSEKNIDIYYTAQDIPFFYGLNFPELMYFKLYAWNDTDSRFKLSYKDFCNTLDKEMIQSLYKQLFKAWVQMPSIDIWTNQTIDTLLRLLEYYFEIGAFENKETVLMLLNQLQEMLEMINGYAVEGCKGDLVKAPFALYLCNVDVENNFMLVKRKETMSCTIRLFTINSIVTENESFCFETDKWINDLISKSILISGGTSARERIRFFQHSKNKIGELINKLDLK